ncbi:MAG: nickel-type superoxide dismutase maturation protease [Anaerolineae bacterium]
MSIQRDDDANSPADAPPQPLPGSNLKEVALWLLRLRRRVRVTGHSMYPLLRPGDELLVDPRAYRRTAPRPGDIVIARHPFKRGARLVKRVVSVTNEGQFHLTGEDPLHSDDSRRFGPLPAGAILGRVTARFP